MDAHYHIVMKARESVTDDKTQLYFAYSTILDRQAFLEWRDQHSYQFFDLPKGQHAEAIDSDLEFNFLSRWWGGRVAGLVSKPGSSVHGLLFEISSKDWPVIRHKEGFVTGMCVEVPVKVKIADQIVDAIAFATAPNKATDQGPISKRFLDALANGAKQSGLPKEYLDKITSFPTT